MFFKAAIAALAALALITAALYWRNGVLSDKLAASEIRAENAVADMRLTQAAMKALTGYTSRISRLMQEQGAVERSISEKEGANDPADQATVDFIRSIGLLAE